MTEASISVVVPTLNAEKYLPGLLESLLSQSVVPDEILVIDSASDDRTTTIAGSFARTEVRKIKRSDFNHGTTRHDAFLHTFGDYVCFMTQDAVPADTDYLENLIKPLERDREVALSSGRQLPKNDARRFEQLVRNFNYPAESHIRAKSDLETYGVKTFFASDVCSAYRRDAYLSCGGFSKVNTNEDMLMAARFIGRGFKVAYAADAKVYHSHNLTLSEQYRRNKEIGFFMELNKKELLGVNETGEGARLAKTVSLQLLQEGEFAEWARFMLDCCARIAGNRSGRHLARCAK